MAATNDEIEDYYDRHQINYTLFWSRTGLHYGLWYPGTKCLAEAIRNTDGHVVNTLKVNSNDIVLDAGCGVGGTAEYMARTTGARVTGITLSTVQLAAARQRAARSTARKRLKFSRQDFTNTTFKRDTFSKAFGIESVCHAHRKQDFLREAHRILKPGGKLAVIDGFLTKKNLDPAENRVYEKFIEGWRVPNLATTQDFTRWLRKAGFKKITFEDMLPNIRRSSRLIHRLAILSYPLTLIRVALGKPQNLSGIYQKHLFDTIATYGLFTAEA